MSEHRDGGNAFEPGTDAGIWGQAASGPAVDLELSATIPEPATAPLSQASQDFRAERQARRQGRRAELNELLGYDLSDAGARAERRAARNEQPAAVHPDTYPAIDKKRRQRWEDREADEEMVAAKVALPGRAERELKSYQMAADCVGEERKYFKPTPTDDTNRFERTKYYNDEERAAHEVGAVDGLLTRADGSLMDTTGAAATNRKTAEQGMNIFALTADRETGSRDIFAADAVKERTRSMEQADQARRLDPDAPAIIEHTHHTSFSSGGEVQGAGEIGVKEGWVKSVSNESGHYVPGAESNLQTLDALEGMGANLDATRVSHMAADTSKSTFMARAYRESGANLPLLNTHKQAFKSIRGRGTTPEHETEGAQGLAPVVANRGGAVRELERLMPSRTEAAPSAAPSGEGAVDRALGEGLPFARWQSEAAQRLESGDLAEDERLRPLMLSPAQTRARLAEVQAETEDTGRADEGTPESESKAIIEAKAIVEPKKILETPSFSSGGGSSSYNSSGSSSYNGSGGGTYDDYSSDDDSSEEEEEELDEDAEAARVDRARELNLPDAQRGAWSKFGDSWVENDGENSRQEAHRMKPLLNARRQPVLDGIADSKVGLADEMKRNLPNPEVIERHRKDLSKQKIELSGRPAGREVGEHVEFNRGEKYADEATDYPLRTLDPMDFNEVTHMYGPEERKAHELGARDGLLTGAGGQLLDTTSAAATDLATATGGRHIFALDHDMKQGRKLYGADAAAENAAFLEKAQSETGSLKNVPTVGHVHHSSFTGGGSVHGAGELAAKEGWLQTISNMSGHYLPDMQGSVQTLEALNEMGVNTDATKVEHSDDVGGRLETNTYMARAVAATGGDRKLMDAHQATFADLEGHADESPAARLKAIAEARKTPVSKAAPQQGDDFGRQAPSALFQGWAQDDYLSQASTFARRPGAEAIAPSVFDTYAH